MFSVFHAQMNILLFVRYIRISLCDYWLISAYGFDFGAYLPTKTLLKRNERSQKYAFYHTAAEGSEAVEEDTENWRSIICLDPLFENRQ